MFFSAVLVAANAALLDLADVAGAALPEASTDTLTVILTPIGKPYEVLAARGYRQTKLPNDLAHRALANPSREAQMSFLSWSFLRCWM